VKRGPQTTHNDAGQSPCVVVTVFAQSRYHTRQGLYSQASAALCAARVHDLTAAGSLHTNQKTVGFLATGNGWLIGTFHDVTLIKTKTTKQWLQKFVLGAEVDRVATGRHLSTRQTAHKHDQTHKREIKTIAMR
jgi:hypothetical protein